MVIPMLWDVRKRKIISDLGDSSHPIPPTDESVGILVRKYYEEYPHTSHSG
jgi:hypothetical protein